MLCKEALFDLFAYFKQSLLNYIDVVSELISDIECESREWSSCLYLTVFSLSSFVTLFFF